MPNDISFHAIPLKQEIKMFVFQCNNLFTTVTIKNLFDYLATYGSFDFL